MTLQSEPLYWSQHQVSVLGCTAARKQCGCTRLCLCLVFITAVDIYQSNLIQSIDNVLAYEQMCVYIYITVSLKSQCCTIWELFSSSNFYLCFQFVTVNCFIHQPDVFSTCWSKFGNTLIYFRSGISGNNSLIYSYREKRHAVQLAS